MKRHCKFSDNKIEAALWKISKLTCWTLLLLLGVLLFDTVPWVLVIAGVLGISLFVDAKINEDDEMETIDKNKKHDCENCIHKVVCALWEIQNELCDSECAYYQPTLTPPNEPLTLISMDDEPPPDKERVLVYRPCMIDSDIGPYSVQWGWAAKKDGSHWAHLPKRRPPEGEA